MAQAQMFWGFFEDDPQGAVVKAMNSMYEVRTVSSESFFHQHPEDIAFDLIEAFDVAARDDMDLVPYIHAWLKEHSLYSDWVSDG